MNYKNLTNAVKVEKVITKGQQDKGQRNKKKLSQIGLLQESDNLQLHGSNGGNSSAVAN
jgi:hypothetical protein